MKLKQRAQIQLHQLFSAGPPWTGTTERWRTRLRNVGTSGAHEVHWVCDFFLLEWGSEWWQIKPSLCTQTSPSSRSHICVDWRPTEAGPILSMTLPVWKPLLVVARDWAITCLSEDEKERKEKNRIKPHDPWKWSKDRNTSPRSDLYSLACWGQEAGLRQGPSLLHRITTNWLREDRSLVDQVPGSRGSGLKETNLQAESQSLWPLGHSTGAWCGWGGAPIKDFQRHKNGPPAYLDAIETESVSFLNFPFQNWSVMISQFPRSGQPSFGATVLMDNHMFA